MDNTKCNVIYVDRQVECDTIYRPSPGSTVADVDIYESGELRNNLNLLIGAFGDVHVCRSGAGCISKLIQLLDTSMVELKPTIVLIDTPHDEEFSEPNTSSRDPSPMSKVSQVEGSPRQTDEEPLYGMRLLERVVYETHSRNLSKLVVPIPVISFPMLQNPPANDGASELDQLAKPGYIVTGPDTSSRALNNQVLLRKCLDSGAVDVMASPLHKKTLTTFEVHAYRAHKEAAKEQQALLEIRRGRKRSWVGVHDERPFSYLREAMVSNLMNNICRSGSDSAENQNVKINVSSERQAEISSAVGSWHFNAHQFSDDDLIIAAKVMFKHALAMPELEKWRIPTDQLITFLVACRAAYNTFVPYHNFRHAVDVLQATFSFLVHVGSLPPFPAQSGEANPIPKSPLAAFLGPFEALMLLISAIGHDVGHPGVNNGFLVTLNAPLAQLYNDRSVLESFHCAAYSQILRRCWPQAFEDTKMRSLMISSVLATDMGLHFDYMKRLSDLEEKLAENPSTDDWTPRMVEEQTAFACSLLIKCADISNVARKHEAALRWMYILCDEFSRQASMEKELGIKSSLISPPKKDFSSLAKAQLGFMNMFAIPLFQGVANVVPSMQYTVDELQINKGLFEKALEDLPTMDEERRRRLTEGSLSPRSMSMILQSDDSRDSSSGKTQTAAVDVPENHAQLKASGSSPPQEQQHIRLAGPHTEINGFDSVTEFAASDPFNINDHDNRLIGHNGKQRCSETTESSSNAPGSGDWHSQATSATTNKMARSPSTQGTSIISQESMDRSVGVPVTTITAPESSGFFGSSTSNDRHASDEDSNGHTLKPDDKGLKKKTSRFRMNLSLFRRNRGSHSPSSGGESG